MQKTTIPANIFLVLFELRQLLQLCQLLQSPQLRQLRQLRQVCQVCQSDIDKSLGLEKFSKRNNSDFSRSREANFHVLFSSRFTRIGETVSLSPLDFQDNLDQFLFLLSIFKIFEINFSFSSRFSRFQRKFHCLLSIFKILLMNIFIIDH